MNLRHGVLLLVAGGISLVATACPPQPPYVTPPTTATSTTTTTSTTSTTLAPAPIVSNLSLSTPTSTTVTSTFSVDWQGAGAGSCSLSINGGPSVAGSCSSISTGGLSPGQSYNATVTATNTDNRQGSAQGSFSTPGRRSITSYNRMAPGAPHNGYFLQAWQSFTAQSNTLTYLGVTVGSLQHVQGTQIRIRVCSATDAANGCAGTTYLDTYATIQNYGNTDIDVGDVAVTPGQSYYVVWSQPSGRNYYTYWWAGGSTITTSDQMQMIVQGYNR